MKRRFGGVRGGVIQALLRLAYVMSPRPFPKKFLASLGTLEIEFSTKSDGLGLPDLEYSF